MERIIHPESTSAFDQRVTTFGKSSGIETPSGNNLGPFSKLFYASEAILKQQPLGPARVEKTEQLHEYIKQMEREKSELERHCSKLESECKRLQSVVLQQREGVLGSYVQSGSQKKTARYNLSSPSCRLQCAHGRENTVWLMRPK